MGKPSIEVIDLTGHGSTTVVITPPNKTYMVEVTGVAVTFAIADNIGITVGSESTGHQEATINAASDLVRDRVGLGRLSTGTATSVDFTTEVWGLLQVMPTVWTSNNLTVSNSAPGTIIGLQSNPIAQSTFTIVAVNGNNITGGTLYITYHKRNKIEVDPHDFAATPLAQKDYTSIGGFNTFLMVSADLEFDGSNAARLRVSTDGVSFDSGASDYREGHWNAGTQAEGEVNGIQPGSGTANANYPFIALLAGLKAAFPTTLFNGSQQRITNDVPAMTTRYRDNEIKHTALRLDGTSGDDMDAGTVYLMKVK